NNRKYMLFNAHGDVVQLTGTDGNVIKSYDYDAFGNEKNLDQNDTNVFRYCGEYFDKETGTIYLRARYYNPGIGRFIPEDPIGAGLNWYTYSNNNPIMFIDPFGLEAIIISGNHNDNYAARNFIEPAIKQAKDWQENGETDITWLLVNYGYSDKDIELIQQTADDLGIQLKLIENEDDLVSYINDGKDRNKTENKITDITFFSHAKKGYIALDYGLGKMNFDTLDIMDLNKNAFASDVFTKFYSCNTGTGGNKSFAQYWVNWVGGTASAVVDGKTNYNLINDGYGLLWKFKDYLRRKKGINFDKNGSLNYPVANPGVKWRTFYSGIYD
ncbi:MAG: RHS repeat-associated core domain-containing protein, partial [Clostridia bacterium]|nr:RHS repeat-associated core domain-containing protein [Clostridia bacterium]